MNKMGYIRLIWRNNRGFAIFSMVFITLLQFLILYLVTTFDTLAIVSAILDQIPEKMRIFLNESFFNMLTFDGAAAFGFNHPLVLAVLAINAINIPVHHISRELETGTLELLLAHPFKRQSLIISLWFSGCIILCAIIVAALIGSFSAIALFHQLSMGILLKMFQISFNLWMLFVLIFTYTLLIASFGKTGSKAGNISAVVTFVFYMLHFLSQLWSSIEFTKPFNIFTYYEPQNLMFKQDNIILNSVALGSLILICLLLSLWQFNRRDIP